ncbi:hypothetical protein SERLADRAFT_412257 [Serpula lacrymans var. lacrymans S7.9]|uniref:Uncharacterized protein n=1 Tax=Serpula lacrymans var. lacrymans (strain S7.9) TaxID=578457 RepID=F8PEQ7_SERL9|nr:uncharacterized protein SERLADRAFT_412257 [Serpula lacrymans var. lacrymans S7.9]EGO18389.1 hypothetical protein SERLADRAFT_412257 [Serpula lacrymans var. lacrymans S7.9]
MPILIDESDNHSSLQSQPPANPLPSSPDIINFDWGLLDNPSHVVLDLPPEQEAVASIALAALDHFNALLDSSNEDLEWSDAPSNDDLPEVTVIVNNGIETASHGRKRARTADHTATSRRWFPWQDKVRCTLDILMHLPRSVFSQKQLDLFLWLLKVNDVDDAPSVKAMQSLNSALQKCCGIGTIAYKGVLGHHYHEMSNPKGLRWLREVPDEQLTPMARLNSHNYYIHKPAMLSDGCNDHPIMFARCWAMEPVDTDHQRSWKVIKCDDYVVSQNEFLMNFPQLSIVDSKTSSTSKWAFTDLNVGNQWRALLKGHKVLSFPIWMYCDDTSGLPQSEAQQEYNYQLSSNAQKSGVWSWDSQTNEPVLLLPFVLALLGDNPMQSEFACHIGLHGKLFCRACWVKGIDAGTNILESAGQRVHQESNGAKSDADSQMASNNSANEGTSNPASETESVHSNTIKCKRRQGLETMANMLSSVQDFVKVGKPQKKQETITQLHAQFVQASQLDSKTKVDKMRTESGIKDTFQKYFIDKVVGLYQRLRGVASK